MLVSLTSLIDFIDIVDIIHVVDSFVSLICPWYIIDIIAVSFCRFNGTVQIENSLFRFSGTGP